MKQNLSARFIQRKVEMMVLTWSDFHEQIFNHSQSPLTLESREVERCNENDFGGMVAIQSDSVQKRNK